MYEASSFHRDSSKFDIMCVALRLEKLDICGFPKCELGSGGPLPDSHSNGFWAVKVGEGDCNEFYKAIKSVHQRRKRASMDRETTWTDLLLQNFTFAKHFNESLTIKSLLWKKREDPHKPLSKRTPFFYQPILICKLGTSSLVFPFHYLKRASAPVSFLSGPTFCHDHHDLGPIHPNCKLYETISWHISKRGSKN